VFPYGPHLLAISAVAAMAFGPIEQSRLFTDHVRPLPTAGASAVSLDPCKILSKEQIATVLPNHDGGFIAHAGGSLIQGVDAYQCSYTDPNANVFTVVVNIAVDGKRFGEIKPHFFSGEATKVPVGEGGWLRGETDDMKLTAVKGRAVLDLELLAPDARQKGPAMVILAKAAIARL
jgi:hypothetical protein